MNHPIKKPIPGLHLEALCWYGILAGAICFGYLLLEAVNGLIQLINK